MDTKINKKNSVSLARYEKVAEPNYVVSEENKVKGNFPKKKYRAGAVAATVWENKAKNSQGESNSYQTISLERVYQDKEGNWKSTNSFRVNDLPKVSIVMQRAYQELILKEQDLFRNN